MFARTTKTIFYSALLLGCLTGAVWGAGAPMSICSYRLGADINDYQGRIDWDTVLPIRYQPYLKEVQIIPDREFKSGLLTFGDCAVKGRIMRIKLKYIDETEAFYKNLLKRFQKRFGKPDEWRGDAFGVVLAWKWSFVDADGRHISLTLQHNHLDQDQKMGNSVKLSIREFFEEEHDCHVRHHQQSAAEEKNALRLDGDLEWDRLIPR